MSASIRFTPNQQPPCIPVDEGLKPLSTLLAAIERAAASDRERIAATEFSRRLLPLFDSEDSFRIELSAETRRFPDIDQLVDLGCLCRTPSNQDAPSLALTPKGARICREVVHAFLNSVDGVDVPVWNSADRTLAFGGEVIRKFRRTAPNQEMLLSQFEERGWPEHLIANLADDDGFDSFDRLKETIKSLNASLKEGPIRFRADGTGRGVRWGPYRESRQGVHR